MSVVNVDVDDYVVQVGVVDARVAVSVPTVAVTVALAGSPGPAGPTAVSTDPGNIATLGSDSLIYVPGSGGGGSGGISQADADLRYANITGDTMTGPLHLAGDPSTALEAATKQYADTKVPALNGVGGLWKGTQAQYDALSPKNPDVVYIII